jgi:hypothetical protein
MTDTTMAPGKSEGREPARPAVTDEQLADQLLGKAQAGGVELLCPDGLLSQVTKAVEEPGSRNGRPLSSPEKGTEKGRIRRP